MSSPAFTTAAWLVVAGIPPSSPSTDASRLYRRRHDLPQVATTLTALSLACGCISVFATLFAFYWFVKMRRSFRHDLIMLLIQSDFIKALWFTIFPIVSFARGPIPSDSAFCQASGFFLTFGIESSDVAVLLIAVHSIMYIFRPQSGLYPHRRVAYAVWFLFPLAIASLAFINGSGYENIGHYCYLNTDQSWARLWLSWVPRYVICGTILVLYVFVYAYVRRKMDAYGRRSSAAAAAAAATAACPRPLPSQGGLTPPLHGGLGPLPLAADAARPPATPPMAYHGLIPSTPSSRRGSAAPPTEDADGGAQERRFSVATLLPLPRTGGEDDDAAERPMRQHPQLHHMMHWTWSLNKRTAAANTAAGTAPARSLVDEEVQDPLMPRRPGPTLAPAPAPAAQSKGQEGEGGGQPVGKPLPVGSRIWHQALGSVSSTHSASQQQQQQRRPSGSKLPGILRAAAGSAPTPSCIPPPQGHEGQHDPYTTSFPGADEDTGIARHRATVRRQLRALFVYPLAYVLSWVFPFASHMRGLDRDAPGGAAHPDWLLVVGIISLCVQGAVDAALFTARERPWRHRDVRRGSGGWVVAVKLGGRGTGGRGIVLGEGVMGLARWIGRLMGLGMGVRMGGMGRARTGAGRTREEMLVHGRLARARRKEEIAAESGRSGSGGAEGAGRMSSTAGSAGAAASAERRTRREWWDVEHDDDGLQDV
ncbi:hypothetical protein P8C59_000810 [Phyllachora maydis]|uniref:Uncharacterized protein n=1 Tax=Phyllachora maydis TaxID=1825666 RepID=A0AAD9HX73_9PEZI|nr:hypothetical protein P8C59_000810 [Phyllachora maydis]